MLTTLPSTIDRFAFLLTALRESVAASHRSVAGSLIVLICTRLGRILARFAAAARVGSGARRGGTPRARVRPAACDAAAVRSCSSAAWPSLSGGFGWLVRLVPATAAYSGHLQHLLFDPEMVALVAAEPQVGRILRPLCRMLAIEPPPGLRAPPRRRKPAVRAMAASEAAERAPSATPSSRAQRGDPLHRPPCALWLELPRRAAARDNGEAKDEHPPGAVGMSPLAPA